MLEFLLAVFRTAIGHFWNYNGRGMHLALFFMALLFLLAVVKKEEEEPKILLVGYSILFALIYLCPITAYIIMYRCIGENVYWRMFWLLPVLITISYVLVRWLFQTKGRMQFALFFIGAAVVIVITGTPVYTRANFQTSENEYKIPQSAIDICDFIEEDYQGEGNPKVTVPNELLCYIRQYDAGIRMPYGRNALKEQKLNKRRTKIYQMMSSGQVDWKKLIVLLKKEESDYFVYATGVGSEELSGNGYVPVGEVEGYTIYYCEQME